MYTCGIAFSAKNTGSTSTAQHGGLSGHSGEGNIPRLENRLLVGSWSMSVVNKELLQSYRTFSVKVLSRTVLLKAHMQSWCN